MRAFFGWLAWLWRTRNCGHLRRRRIYGDEWMIYGYRSRCLDCGKALDVAADGTEQMTVERAEARDRQED